MNIYEAEIYLAQHFPDWNSLESVRSAHSFLEAFALVCFALLVICDFTAHFSSAKEREKILEGIGLCFFSVAVLAEISAYPYSQRNDRLSAEIIGSLDEKAKNAASNAQSALDLSSAAKAQADMAGASAKTASEAAGVAQGTAESAERKADDLDRVLVGTASRLDVVEAKRASLESSLMTMAFCNAPRIIMTWSWGQNNYAEPLKPLAGRTVLIEYLLHDAEAFRAARYIRQALVAANADVRPLREVEVLADGVTVQASENWSDTGNNAHDAAATIVDFLHSFNWQANIAPLMDNKLRTSLDGKIVPLGGIRVQVGLYPAVIYVGSPGSKVFEDAMIKINQQHSEREEAAREALRQSRERALNGLSTEERERAEESYRQEDTLRIKARERYDSPCQPLAGVPLIQ